ncbi:hypothetical protein HK104_010151 [Borealophlyctis nickersoniae]|nr:hypothetical protein HK104_010151 [Borealophlyctis nickersoniae]
MLSIGKLVVVAAAAFSSFSSAIPLQRREAFDYPYGSADVHVVQSQHTERTYNCERGGCPIDYKFSVGLAVRNKVYDKNVGIRWTKDNWMSHNESSAAFVRKIDDSYELWSLDVLASSTHTSVPKFEVSFNGFASFQNGPRTWDPNGNYFIYSKVSPAQPLNVAASAAQYDAASKSVYLTVGVHTYPFDDSDTQNGKVKIIWTIDNWKTNNVAPAETFNKVDKLWQFRFPVVVPSANTPENVTFAVVYESSKGKFWYNNDGKNVVVDIRPYSSSYVYSPVHGTASFTVSIWGAAFDLRRFEARIDNGEWKDITNDFGSYKFDSTTLSNGSHKFQGRALVEDGTVVFHEEHEFTVQN